VGIFQSQKMLGRGMPKRLRALKFVSVNRRTCSLSNAAENVQHPNFNLGCVPQPAGRDAALAASEIAWYPEDF
jgi:hypothetical protein